MGSNHEISLPKFLSMENQPNTPSNNRIHLIYLGIIAVLVALGSYLFITKSKTETVNENLTEEMGQVVNDKQSLQQDFNAALTRLDQLTTDNTQMDSLLQDRGEEVDALKSKIQSILSNKNASEASLRDANRMISQLNSQINGFESQLKVLKQENIQLTEEKRDLIQEKGQLQEEGSTLREEKKELQKTVELGSVLHASGFTLEAINKKKNFLGKEKEVETAKAKRADYLRITFDLDENRISESGEKLVYLCVIGPAGVVSAEGQASGIFNLSNGAEKKYTVKKTVAFKRGEGVNDIVCDWKPEGNFQSGKYQVEVYHMGYKIGGEMVVLK